VVFRLSKWIITGQGRHLDGFSSMSTWMITGEGRELDGFSSIDDNMRGTSSVGFRLCAHG
jgi:hypothetical protein